jgi:poly-gamma-glutamate capsule biosynthesis protein CapA/YwtB (metallophosphatase superfamily)
MPSHPVITIFMCGDVMTGRGIDQVLPYPSDPHIHEPYVRDARRYVELAEAANGPIPKPVNFAYIWGDALDILERMAPDVKIINLETSITTCDDYWKGKGINYRMHPRNISCLTAAGIHVCTLANNHVLDWGYGGLLETQQVLKKEINITSAGAGRSLAEAAAPAVMEVAGKGRVIVFSFGSETSGIPAKWAAGANSAGVHLVPDLSDKTVSAIQSGISAWKRPGDIVVASIHWGGNWGYVIPGEETEFAHNLIDHAGVDIVHGHSSHHAKGIEVYHGKPVIYGCGDFINDYEGIYGYEQFMGELGLMYFVQMDPSSGKLSGLRMKPTRMKRFTVHHASHADALWLRDMLNREGKQFGTGVNMDEDTTLNLWW